MSRISLSKATALALHVIDAETLGNFGLGPAVRVCKQFQATVE